MFLLLMHVSYFESRKLGVITWLEIDFTIFWWKLLEGHGVYLFLLLFVVCF